MILSFIERWSRPMSPTESGPTMLLTVDETARHLRIAKRRVWTLIEDGSLPSVKIGRSRRISQAAVAEYIRKLEADARAASQA